MRNLLCALLLWTSPAWASQSDVVVDQVWMGESIPGQSTATLELNVTTVKAATLVSVTCDVADKVEIHNMFRHRGKMEAQVVDHLRLPAHRTISFGAHRLFLIVVGLKREINVDEHIPVNLVFEYSGHRRQTITVEAVVKKMSLSYKHLGVEAVHDHR